MARNLQVDTLRGLACIFLVAYHVVGYDAAVGLRIDSGPYREVSDLLAYLRMPLFTFLSGMVYAYRPFTGGVRRFVVGKSKRLLLPMLVVGTFFALVQSWAPDTNGGIENWYLLHIYPVAHFWFIEAVFWIFLLMIPLEMAGAFRTRTGFLLVLFAAVCLYLSVAGTPLLAISGAIYLLPYFLLGMGMQRYLGAGCRNLWLGLGLTAIVTVVLVMVYLGDLPQGSQRSVLALGLGGTACAGLLLLNLRSKTLACVGVFSFSIYLYHVFFTAGTRMFLRGLEVEGTHTLFVVSICTGLAGPILLHLVLGRLKLLWAEYFAFISAHIPLRFSLKMGEPAEEDVSSPANR